MPKPCLSAAVQVWRSPGAPGAGGAAWEGAAAISIRARAVSVAMVRVTQGGYPGYEGLTRPVAPVPRCQNRVMEPRGSILVVDDEATITEVVSRYLERAGYATHVAADGPGALRIAGESHPDLVVLDLMLPGMDGLEVMRRLRERERVSVILLTAKGEHTDRIIGLRLGADDYVVKPFSPAELVARVDAVLRRVDNSPELEEPIVFDDLELDPVARRVTVRGEEVQLTMREYDLLLHFMRHPGQVFSRDQLMDAVWQYSFYTDTSTVTVHTRRLRAKIEPDPSEPRWLQTVWGVGYRFQP